MLEKLKNYFFKTCDETGNIKGIKFNGSFWSYMLFPITGIVATIWVLIRIIPRPDRIRYPCMKIAIPISSSFLAFIAGLFTSLFSLKKIKEMMQNKKVNLIFVSILSVVFLVGAGTAIVGFSKAGYSEPNIDTSVTEELPDGSNNPMGEAKGIYPGRVVWIHDGDATNENLSRQDILNGDGWFKEDNNNQKVIDEMLDQALKEMSGQNKISKAWSEIFKYHNEKRGKGKVGYSSGEKIFLKINLTSSWSSNIKDDLTIVKNGYYGISETSPQLVLSVLRQLVNVVGVDQSNIYVGDPMKQIYQHRYELWSNEFPDVHYLDHSTSNFGREKVEEGEATINYSDQGEIIDEEADNLYKIFEETEYLINIPTLKGHKNAGVTMFAKNHFGSHIRDNAAHLHDGLMFEFSNGGWDKGEDRFGYGKYRVLVDFMGHELFKEKSLIYLMDALWSSHMEVTQPNKWQIPPFNNDWSSSIFISQDQVAIESVGYDFLRAEYTEENHPELNNLWPQLKGTDDYLHQAADPSNWPDNITYNPDGSEEPQESIGVHEHWNNKTDRQYSRNLDSGNGIELRKLLLPEGDLQDDTVIANNIDNVKEAPNIDGKATESCWKKSEWQNIGQTWLPYGQEVSASDFSGKYKVLWSSSENKLYFLIEVTDDQLVDGYEKGEDGYYHYDITEIFIDEDNSGGPHVFDTENSNAENAFSYHMNVNYPEVGDTVQDFLAIDIAGESWSNMSYPDYSDHFPEHVLRRYEDKVIREFSLKVYDDSYNDQNPAASRVELTEDKVMGLSLAYCDNDDPHESPIERDNFFGSVAVAAEDSNSHWKNADEFGTIKLIDSTTTPIANDMRKDEPTDYKLHNNFPNPFNPTTTIKYEIPKLSKVTIVLYDIKGRKVKTLVNRNHQAGKYQLKLNASNMASGVYFYKIEADNFTNVKKCMLIK